MLFIKNIEFFKKVIINFNEKEFVAELKDITFWHCVKKGFLEN
jgi:hypothetical protein